MFYDFKFCKQYSEERQYHHKKRNTDRLLMRIEHEKITGYLFASRDYYHDYLLGLLPTISGRKKSIFP